MTNRSEGKLRASLVLILSIGCALGLNAQPAATNAGDDVIDDVVELERFVTTASVVPRAKNETFSPVAVVSSGELARAGATTAIEALRELPLFFGNSATEQRSNSGNGAAGVNLRGLEAALTLLDGKRTAHDNFNAFPTIAIESVEIVKDAAGAIYGSDAMAGVFNVKLLTRFEGAKVDLYYGNTTAQDAGVLRAGAVVGHTVKATNIVVAAERYTRNALNSIDREPSATADQRFRGGLNGGTPSFSGRATARVGDPSAPVQDLVLAPGRTIGLSAADFIPFDANTSTSNQMMNFRELTVSIPRQERTSLFARVNQSLWKGRIDVYARLLYSRDDYFGSIAPAPMPITGTAGTALRNAMRLSPHIPVGFFIQDNASAPVSTAVNGSVPFRTVSLGPRGLRNKRDVWDFAAGAEGKIGAGWTWNLDTIYSTFYRDNIQSGAPSRARLVAHLTSGSYNPWALDSARGVGPTGVAFDNPAALRDAAAQAEIVFEEVKRGVTANAKGQLWTLPAGPLLTGVGADYYFTDRRTSPDPILGSGDLLGASTSNPSISGSDGKGVFAQLLIPLIGPAMGVPWVNSAELNLEARHDRQTVDGYTTGATPVPVSRDFSTTNPKVGFQLRPTPDVLLRAAWSTGFRLPALNQLFAGPGAASFTLRDPLGFPIANQTTVATSGNRDLKPETSETYSAGVVWSPRAAKGISLSLDYYQATLDDMVGEGAQFILETNARGQGAGFTPGVPIFNPAAPFAAQITRNASGSVTGVSSTNFNIATRMTSGFDASLLYVWPWESLGRFTTRLEWNHVLMWKLRTVEGEPTRSFRGIYIDPLQSGISPGSIPEDKAVLSQQWSRGAWTLFGSVNYVGKLQDNPLFTRDGLPRTIEPWVTVDLTIALRLQGGAGWRRVMDQTTVRVGGANILDESAPFAAGAFNDSYDVSTHSNRGRFVFVQITKRL